MMTGDLFLDIMISLFLCVTLGHYLLCKYSEYWRSMYGSEEMIAIRLNRRILRYQNSLPGSISELDYYGICKADVRFRTQNYIGGYTQSRRNIRTYDVFTLAVF